MENKQRSDCTRLQRLGGYLAQDPTNATLLQDYAQEAWRSGEWQACVVATEKLRALGQASIGSDVLHARALRKLGRPADALASLQATLLVRPDHALALAVEIAECHLETREYEAALESLPAEAPPGSSASSDPREASWRARATSLRVRCLHHLGELEAAASVAECDLQQQGWRPEVQASALPVWVDLAQLDRAVNLAQRLLEGGSEEAPYEVAEPLALQSLAREDAAVTLHWTGWAQARRRDDGRIWLIAGLAHLQGQSSDSALSALEQAVAWMPQHAGSWLALGWACLLAGLRERAREVFEEALRVSPSFAETHGSLAVLEVMEGHQDAARAAIRRAQGLDKQGAAALYAQALLNGHSAEDIHRLAGSVVARARASGPAPDARPRSH